MFCLVFAIAWLPLIFSITGAGDADVIPFSIYNEGEYPEYKGNGCSKLKEALTELSVNIDGEDKTLEVHPLISSLSVVNGINTNSVLVVLGATLDFSIIETSALIDFFDRGGCLVIADDFGSGNRILDNLAVLSPNVTSLEDMFTLISQVRFDGRLLLDANSNDGGKPLLPVITSFNDGGEIFHNTQRVIMNYATGITGASSNFRVLASSSDNSWVTSSWEDPAYDSERDDAWGGDDPGPFSLMGTMQIGHGLLVLISDPSIFVNDMIIRGDNRLFAEELFTYLAQRANTNTIIIDHYHLSWVLSSPVLLVGLMLGQTTYLSTNWLLAPLAPILAVFTVRRYLPFGRPKKRAPREIYRRRGQTLFTQALYDYIQNQRFNETIQIVYGKLKRDLMRRHGLRVFDVPRLMVHVSRTRQPSDIAILNKDFEALEKAIQQSKRIDRDKFIDLFFKIKRIRENIG